MKTIKWGIIGCGNVTEIKSGPAFNKIQHSELVAVMRRNSELARDYAMRHGVPAWYSSAEELINDPNVNAVYVATPPDSHAKYAIMAMEAGKPCYVEKPMALSYAECQEMNEVSETTGMPLFVAYYRRGLPGFLKVKDLISKGEIGKVRTVNLQLYKYMSEAELSDNKPWRVIPSVSGGGHFVDLASHQLDYFDFLFGPVKEVIGMAKNQANQYAAEDMVSASFLYEDDIILTGSWCFTVPEFLRRDTIEIVGSKGSISFSAFNFTPIEVRNSEGTREYEYPRPPHVQEDLIRQIVAELRSEGECFSTGASAARTNKVMDRVLKSYYS